MGERDKPAVEVTKEMVEAGLRVLRRSGKLWAESSSDELTIRSIIEAALSAGKPKCKSL